MFKEFKEFALKGNVMDLAIGVIIGGAFGKIVDSLVNDIVMPLIGGVVGKVDFHNKFISLVGSNAATLEEAKKAGATLAYGSFITVVINFVILAFVIFLMVKAINQVRREEATEPAAPPAPTTEEKLLTEIRDLLKARTA